MTNVLIDENHIYTAMQIYRMVFYYVTIWLSNDNFYAN